MIKRLFSSRVRIALLRHFLLSQGVSSHVRELAETVGAQYSAVWNELRNLESAGILKSEKRGRSRFFSVDPNYPLLPELRGIFTKTVGVGDAIRDRLVDIPGIEIAFIYGSFAKGDFDARSDVDLMIVGEPSLEELAASVGDLEASLNREINYVLLTPQEWSDRIAADDPFIVELLLGPLEILLGGKDAIRATTEGRSDTTPFG